jgi:hypothetical protein
MHSRGARIFCDKSRILRAPPVYSSANRIELQAATADAIAGSDSGGSDLDYSDARSSRSGSIIGGEDGGSSNSEAADNVDGNAKRSTAIVMQVRSRRQRRIRRQQLQQWR